MFNVPFPTLNLELLNLEPPIYAEEPSNGR
jgi:hypothetical protein